MAKSRPATSAEPVAQTVLRLQRLAGNRAVQLLVVQRWFDELGNQYEGAVPSHKDDFKSDWSQTQTRWILKAGKGPIQDKLVKAGAIEALATKAAGPALAQAAAPVVGGVFYLDADQVRFAQDTVSPTFSSGGSVVGLAVNLIKGSVKSSALPAARVFTVKLKGKTRYVTLDNRRLWACKKAQVQIKCKLASKSEIQNEAFKFTSAGGRKGSAEAVMTGVAEAYISEQLAAAWRANK